MPTICEGFGERKHKLSKNILGRELLTCVLIETLVKQSIIEIYSIQMYLMSQSFIHSCLMV